jgi:CHAT domain-containing protein
MTEKFVGTIVGPLPSEEEFLLALQLSEGPSSPMTAGLEDWKQMYRIARECGDPRMTAVALQNIYSGLNSSGKTAEALLCARWLFAVGQRTGDPLVVGHALNDIGWAYWVMGDHVAAFDAAREAVTHAAALEASGAVQRLSAFTGPHAVRSMATDLLRTIRQSRGQLRRALADREATLNIDRQRGDSLRVIGALESLGLVYGQLGDHAAALRCFDEALRETETASFPDERARLLARAGLLGNVGVVLTHQGHTDRALAFIEQEMCIYADLSDEFGRIGGLGQKGRALLRARRVSESIACLDEMLRLAQEFGADSWRQAAHFNLARAQIAAGDLSGAAFHSEQAAALSREKLGRVGVDVHWLRAILFAPMVAANAKRGDPSRFVALAYPAIDALRQEVRGSLPPVVVGRWIDEFEILIDAIFHLSPSTPLQLGVTSFGSSGSPAEQAIERTAAVSPFLGWLPLDIGLYCVESLRAQGFQERLLLDAADLDRGHDQHLVAELARIGHEIDRLDSSQPVIVTGTASFGNHGKLELREHESEKSIAKQERAYNEHYQRRAELAVARDALVRKTIEFADATIAPLPEPARLGDLRDVIRDDELFLEFVLLGQVEPLARQAAEIVQWPDSGRPSASYVIAITRSWMDVILLGQTDEIEARCAKLLDMLDRFGASLSIPFFQSEAASVYDLLLRPVWHRAKSALDSVRHLIIAPDGVLHRLPLDLLVEERYEVRSWCEVGFLARRFSTEYVPSATVFVDARRGRYRRGEPGRLFVGFGDPAYSPSGHPVPLDRLAGTRRELNVISALVRASASTSDGDLARLFIDSEARKDQLTDAGLLSQAKYIHLACHGSAGTPPHAEGALYLAEAADLTPLQSVLTFREVMDLRTSAKLVVLSACESGLGAQSRGEGIQGLTRAWLFAGAEAVVATQWRVDDDATAEVMSELYRALLGHAVSAAGGLAAAKLAAIGSDRFACPVFWAAFVLTGGRRVETSKQRQPSGHLVPHGICHVSHELGSPVVALAERDRALLAECGRTWEAAWKTDRPTAFPPFFTAAAELGRALAARDAVIAPTTRNLLRLVGRNCRVSLDHWAKRQQPAVAVQAYLAYLTWLPSARTDEWDAMVSAYRRENRDAVRRLARDGKLTRIFDLLVEGESDIGLRTEVTFVAAHPVGQIAPAVEVALPVGPSAECSSGRISYCRQLGWGVFRITNGETVRIVECLKHYVHVLDNDTFLVGGTWGSSLIPHDLTIRFHPDFIPLRLQRKRLGRAPSTAAVRFTPEGAVVTLRPIRRPWVERIAILFRRAPGALAMFAAPNSPFLVETEFGEFEGLFEQARRLGEN